MTSSTLGLETRIRNNEDFKVLGLGTRYVLAKRKTTSAGEKTYVPGFVTSTRPSRRSKGVFVCKCAEPTIEEQAEIQTIIEDTDMPSEIEWGNYERND